MPPVASSRTIPHFPSVSPGWNPLAVVIGTRGYASTLPRRHRVTPRGERVRRVAALELCGRPHGTALRKDCETDDADVAVARGVRSVRLGNAAESERGNVCIGRTEAVDHEGVVRIDDVAAAVRVRRLAVDHVE